MLQCPQCSQTLESDFGLVICPGCGASLMIDVDGSVLHQEGSSNESEGSQLGDINGPEGFDDRTKISDQEIGVSEASALQVPEDQNLEQVPMNEWGEEENSKVVTIGKGTTEYHPQNEPIHEANENDRTEVITNVMAHPYDGNYQTYQGEESGEAADIDDIQKFANTSQQQEGALAYNIIIHGIDSMDLRELVKQVLSDRRLLLDAEGMMRSITDGTLTLQNISGIKAFVILNHLKALPLEFEWSQMNHGNP